MKTYGVLLAVLSLVVATSLLSVWFVPSVQEFMAGNTMWNGIRSFLEMSHGRAADLLDPSLEAPESCTLIVIPYTQYDGADLSRMKSFINDGGMVVIMDDFGFGNQILTYFGVTARFVGQPLLDPLFCYKNAWFPKVIDFAAGFRLGDIHEVVLNHATALQNVDPADVLAWSSPTSFVDADGSATLSAGERQGRFAIAARLKQGSGTLVLVSDPSLVINSMINKIDNQAFVNGLIDNDGTTRRVLLDASHLTQTPLDISKSGLTSLHDLLAAPYPSLAILLAIFVVVTLFVLRDRRSWVEQQKSDQ